MSEIETETPTKPMTPQEQLAAAAAQEAEARAILKRDVGVEAAVTMLEGIIEEFNELQNKILPMQQKGLAIPGIEQRVHNCQLKLARAIDTINSAMQKCTDREVVGIAMGVQTVGVQYFQGIFFSIHYSRVVFAHDGDRTFQRLLDTAYKMLERTQQAKKGVIIPQ